MNGNILNNIYNKLSEDKLVDVDFDTWESNFVQDPEVVGNVYGYLSQQGLVTAEPDEWVKNINEELAAKQPKVEEEEKTPKQTAMEGIWQSDAKLTTKLALSASALVQSLKNPEERQQIKQNAKNIRLWKDKTLRQA